MTSLAPGEADVVTLSGEPIKALYTEEDLPADIDAAVGAPGEYPFTRGVYASMYRGRLWTMRQFAGFGTAEGMVRAVKDGYPQREIADAAFELQQDIDAGRRIVVGVNAFTEGDDAKTPILRTTQRSSTSRSRGCARPRPRATPPPSSVRSPS